MGSAHSIVAKLPVLYILAVVHSPGSVWCTEGGGAGGLGYMYMHSPGLRTEGGGAGGLGYMYTHQV